MRRLLGATYKGHGKDYRTLRTVHVQIGFLCIFNRQLSTCLKTGAVYARSYRSLLKSKEASNDSSLILAAWGERERGYQFYLVKCRVKRLQTMFIRTFRNRKDLQKGKHWFGGIKLFSLKLCTTQCFSFYSLLAPLAIISFFPFILFFYFLLKSFYVIMHKLMKRNKVV